MRFNRFLHLIAFSGKAHRRSPASGRVTTKMLDAGAPSQAKRTPDFSRYIPLSGGDLPTAQKPAPSDRLPRMPRPIGQWCGHPFPTPELPPRPSNPAPAATARATFPAPVASEPDTSAVVPQPHPFATAPAVAPSPSCPTATPTLICSPTNSTTVNSTQRQCGFHLGFGLGE